MSVDHDRSYDALSERVRSTENKINSLDREILTAIHGLDDRIEKKVSVQLDTLIRDIATLARRIDKQDERHDETRERVVRLETKHEGLERYIAESHNIYDNKVKEAADKALMKSKLWVYALMFAGVSLLVNILAKLKSG